MKLIKIDVEGADLPVLKGAVKLLERQKPVTLFEHGIGGSDFYGTLPEHVFDLFQGCGMRLFTMRKWLQSHGKSAMTRVALSKVTLSSAIPWISSRLPGFSRPSRAVTSEAA